jgi:DNA-binding NarL/FixJ family response regulator
MIEIRVMIVEDIASIRDYFATIVQHEQDLELVGSASTARQAVEVAREKKPDIVLMDIELERRFAGVDATRDILRELPHTKIIALTIHEDDETLFAMLAAGAMDYIVKTSSVGDILLSIRENFRNMPRIRPDLLSRLLSEFATISNRERELIKTLNVFSKLTKTEFDIIKAVASGLTYQQVANQRYVEETTIRGHVHNILRKFNSKKLRDVVKKLKTLKILDIYS